MKNGLYSRVSNYIADEKIEPRERIIILSIYLVMFGMAISCIPLVLYRMASVWLNVAMIAGCYLARMTIVKYKKLDVAAIGITYFCNLILVPIYFAQGGVRSAMPIWSALIIIMSYVMVAEKYKFVTTFFSFCIAIGCVATEYFNPQWVTPLKTETAFFMDVLSGMFLNAIILLVVFRIHLITTNKQKALLEQQTKELLEKQEELEKLRSQDQQEYQSSLERALAEAKRANAAKSEFLSRMSHDIRTPLNGIVGLMEINDKHADNRALVDENRAKARVAANHLQSLISDVLQLSKMDNENVHLSLKPVNVPALAGEVLTISGLRAAEAGISLEQVGSISNLRATYVYGSPLHLRQIFLNLINNAIKYNKPGGKVLLRIDTLAMNEEEVIYRTVITDTGIGMSEEFVKHIFEPFSQERSDARSTYQGTGLGMAIVKTLVEKMNGNIKVESKPGEGSTFTVTIPFKRASEEELPKSTEIDAIDLIGINVMLVEDNELNMEIATALLEDYKVHITKATNGQEAVDLFAASEIGSYDVILMDVMMPVMDGYAATAAIRSMERVDATQIPVIAMTANAFVEDEQKCLAAGMNAHVTKPIEIKKLVDTIKMNLM